MKAVAHTIKYNKAAYYFLGAGIFLSLVFYMYCINAAVRAAVVRNNAQSKIAMIQGQVSDLESKYMAGVNTLTVQSAHAAGLVDPQEKIFISKNTSGQSLSYNVR
jgi:hypothetical protein